MLQSLAEPNLIAYNGKEASFLAGGEIPVPIVQGGGNGARSPCIYKEFGIRLSFTPTIAGDVIRLQVKPEVSTLDFANGVIARRFPHPGAARPDGPKPTSSCATASRSRSPGLLNNISQTRRESIPLLEQPADHREPVQEQGRATRQRTELMVLITPRLVRPLDPDEVPPLPTDPTRFFHDGQPAHRGRQLAGRRWNGRRPERRSRRRLGHSKP